METEITRIPDLKPDERSLLDLHSLLNVLNVLHGELMMIGFYLADEPELLNQSLVICDHIKASLTDPARALWFAAHVGEQKNLIFADISAAAARHPGKGNDPGTRESLANLQSVFHFLDLRAMEVVARHRQPDRWIGFTLEDLRADFLAVFAAIEKNSKGRYRIIYNLALQKPSDYYVDFVAECGDGRTLALPLLFKDVMRDLIANARKYTAPGGTINIGFHETDDELRFVVQDTGRGIPPGELETVVHFGRRGSNAGDVRTMGGGFGLTKAFLVTKQFGGRFWLKSELGAGTRITIVIPLPTTRRPATPDLDLASLGGLRAEVTADWSTPFSDHALSTRISTH